MSRFLRRLLTQSFPGNREAPPEESASEGQQATEEVDTYESQAFAIWCELLAGQPGCRVLDFGVLRAATLEFFSTQGAELGVVGLDPASPEAGLERFEGGDAFDAALCWDLPNYLDEKALAGLGRWLAERTSIGAPVFLTLATRTPYADRPATHEVADDGHLRARPSTDGATRTVLYSGPRLGRLWPGFEVKRSFLLRSGMQEYVLCRRPAG